MRRKNRLVIGLAAAAITFGSLSFALGFDHWRYCGPHQRGWSHYHGCEQPIDGEEPLIEEGG